MHHALSRRVRRDGFLVSKMRPWGRKNDRSTRRGDLRIRERREMPGPHSVPGERRPDGLSRRAVTRFPFQIGSSTAITSAVLIRSTGRPPSFGIA